jgi:stalled ribosome alternative rescue factor ArfA
MKAILKFSLAELKRQASKIKINNKLDSIVDTPFFKKKMERGRKMLTAPGLPK